MASETAAAHAAPKSVRRALTNLGVATSRPTAFVIIGAYAVIWLIFDRASLDMHGLATLATWLMTLFIQRAEHRDTQAIQAKLDEILKALEQAPDEITRIDDEEAEEIEAEREKRRP